LGILKKTYIFLIAFFIGYPVLYVIQYWRMKTLVDHRDEARIEAIAQMLDHSSDQKAGELFQNMFDTYRQTETIAYYTIRDDKGQLIYPSSENALVKESKYDPKDLYQTKRHIRVQGQNYIVFFGKDDVPFETLLWQVLKDQREVLSVFILGIILLIHQVAAYFLNFDVKNIIQWFKGRGPTGNSEILSTEANRLKDYIDGVEQKRQQAEQLAREYKANSYSGLNWAHEQIQAGKKSVEIVAGRCDINGYTVLKQKISAELLQYIVQTFFNRGGEYLSRYGAYKENAAGDEISFFVPRNEKPDAELIALHIVRGLFEIFHDLGHELNLHQLKLTVKAALDAGTVELEKLGGNSETEGQPLINTARFLTTIDEKQFSMLTVPSASFAKYEDHASIQYENMSKVKNYDEPFQLAYVRSIQGYTNPSESLPRLRYFRTDHDLTAMLREMANAVLNSQDHVFHQLRAHIASLNIQRVSHPVLEQYRNLLKVGMKSTNMQALAGITLLAKTLLTADSVDEETLKDLQQCLQSPNKRVVSNTREAVQSLKPELIDLPAFIKNDDNRVAADALIDLVKIEGLTDEHAKQVTAWLNSKSSAFRLSGLYAAYKIHSHWAEARPEYIQLNPNFKLMDTTIRKLDRTNPNFQKWLGLYEDSQKQSKAG
jgi:class 3 adenylate cyclase